MRTKLAGVALLAVVMSFLACGGEEFVIPLDPPTKDEVIEVLRKVADALEAKDYDLAAAHFIEYPNMTPEAMKTALAGFLEKREISKAGVEILAAKGKFGPLAEVFPEAGARWAEKAGVPLDNCWGISWGDAQVAVAKEAGDPLIFRLDDVGKLE